MSPPEVSAIVLTKMREIAEAFIGREDHGGRRHGPGVLRRRPAAGNEGRRARSPDSTSSESSTSRRRRRSPTGSRRRTPSGSSSTTSAAARSTSRSSRFARGVFSVKATNGDTHLGGEDFDRCIVDSLIERFQQGSRRRPPSGQDGPPAAQGGRREDQARAVFVAGDGDQLCRSSRRARRASRSTSSDR